MSTQAPPHSVRPGWQAHTPFAHIDPSAQGRPRSHEPHRLGSAFSSTHPEEHRREFVGHVHAPATQVDSEGQVVGHASTGSVSGGSTAVSSTLVSVGVTDVSGVKVSSATNVSVATTVVSVTPTSVTVGASPVPDGSTEQPTRANERRRNPRCIAPVPQHTGYRTSGNARLPSAVVRTIETRPTVPGSLPSFGI